MFSLVSQRAIQSFRYLWPTELLRKTAGITDLYKHTRTNRINDKGIKSLGHSPRETHQLITAYILGCTSD